MPTSAQPYLALFHRHLPVRGAIAEISLAQHGDESVRVDEGGLLHVSIQLSVFAPGDPPSLESMKEQELCLAELSKVSEPRALAYLEGHLRALPALLERYGEDVAFMMPADFLGYAEALQEAALEGAADFERAFLDDARIAAWDDARNTREWEEDLAGCELRGRAAEVRALKRPSIRLYAERLGHEGDDGSADPLPIGATRIGGAPDLPPSMPWPAAGDEPLTFVAQLDLAALADLPAARELPRAGVLSFFSTQSRIEGVPGNPVRVIHLENARGLVRRAIPDRVERVPEHAVRAASEWMLPPIESPFYEALLPDETQRAFQRALIDAARGASHDVIDPLEGLEAVLFQRSTADAERPTHRVLGHASSIQGDPYLDIEVEVVRGGYEDWQGDSDEAIRLRRSARRWRLLLQIDASGNGELLLNQDGGFFYFWIPEDALAAGDWSQVRGSLQCH